MKNRKPLTPFAPRAVRRFVLPLTLASIFFMAGIILDGMLAEPGPNIIAIIYGTVWILIILLYDLLIARSTIFHGPVSWFYSITSIIGLGILIYILPPHLGELFHIMIIFGVVVTATVFGRAQAYIALSGILAFSLPGQIPNFVNLENVLEYLMPFIVSTVIMETILRIR